MVQQASNPEPSIALHEELDFALRTLESCLAEAGRAVSAVRSLLPRIASLSEAVGELETAMDRARQRLSASPAYSAPTSQPTLSPVPPSQPPVEFPTPAPSFTPEPAPSFDDTSQSEDDEPASSKTPSHCLRLDVRSKSGSLELKAVDDAVNENTSVVDVALLEYDGRNATLRVWIETSADPETVREALLDSLQRNLAGHQDADVTLDYEQAPAA
ncbi:MAG: hypothetical protein WEE64_09815 [Dehalococcoidia bacterium]